MKNKIKAWGVFTKDLKCFETACTGRADARATITALNAKVKGKFVIRKIEITIK